MFFKSPTKKQSQILSYLEEYCKPEKDVDGCCTICGYEWPDSKLTLVPHECPPGFAYRNPLDGRPISANNRRVTWACVRKGWVEWVKHDEFEYVFRLTEQGRKVFLIGRGIGTLADLEGVKS